ESASNRGRAASRDAFAEGVFGGWQKVVSRLTVRDFAVPLATVTEHDPKDVRFAALAVGTEDRGAGAVVDLRFETGSTFHPAHGQRQARFQLMHKAPHAV